MQFPGGLRYAEQHEWARLEGDMVVVGISDYAQDQLGDITFVELPSVGDTFEKGQEFGTLESVKAVSELFIPLGGEILAANEELAESPGLVNSDPYGRGWLIQVKPTDVEELQSLMTAEQYIEMLRGLG
ncbi:MAG: glycine cleavage system protein GcvH [Deltaproteobacteria bacterium]|nr:glycine cleavage system protein GcvH [Deltaproteobacteria bacterium]